MSAAEFIDMLAAEWLKLRTVRATAGALLAVAVAVATGSLVILAVVGAYDAAPPSERAGFEPADPTVVVIPFVAFFVGSLGGLAVTTEYTIAPACSPRRDAARCSPRRPPSSPP